MVKTEIAKRFGDIIEFKTSLEFKIFYLNRKIVNLKNVNFFERFFSKRKLNKELNLLNKKIKNLKNEEWILIQKYNKITFEEELNKGDK